MHYWSWLHGFTILKEKEGDLTKSYDKNPHTNRKFENQWTIQNATENFDYTTIADQIRTVSLINNSHPTGVVKPVYGYPTFQLGLSEEVRE